MSSTHHHVDPTVPKGALWFAAGLIGFVLAMGGAVRLGIMPISASPAAVRAAERLVPTASRDLSFADRADGGLVITDVKTGVIVKTIHPGEPSGFIRGLLRGMGRERRMDAVARTTPYRLENWSNGQLSITDTGTHRSIELTAFGPTNREAFAVLLK